MKTDPGNHDEPLRRLLKEWRTESVLPPRFHEGVWQRIEKAQPSSSPSVWSTVSLWVSGILLRPALAASYMSFLLIVGVAAGWAQGHHETARVKDELGQRYVRVLDPYLASRQ